MGGGVGAGCFMHTRSSLVFLADFFDEATGYEVLKLLVSTQTKHFLAAAHRITKFQIRENTLEQIVEAEHLFFGKDIAQLIGDMVWKAT